DWHTFAKSLVYQQDAKQMAKEAKLYYVTDSECGITRKKIGKSFRYLYKNKTIIDEITLLRIKQLVIPPAWTHVWICSKPNGHLQATGRDTKNRKQYRYHSLWNEFSNKTKFHRLYEFGKALPNLRKKI